MIALFYQKIDETKSSTKKQAAFCGPPVGSYFPSMVYVISRLSRIVGTALGTTSADDLS